MNVKRIFTAFFLVALFTAAQAQHTVKKAFVPQLITGRWSMEKAGNWYAQHKWISGANFVPSTAINQLEMWQADTFDPETLDRELGWAESLGFNTMRVFLHSVAYKQDPKGFKERVNRYLAIADKHNIQTMFVFFDDVWNTNPKPGKQPEPKIGTHNSGWMQDPGYIVTSAEDFAFLQKYVTDILTTYKADKRVLLWDLYNEPGNTKKELQSLELLTSIFKWARTVNPSQPLSVGLWKWDFEELNAFQALNSDIITYHDYEGADWHKRVIKMLKSHGRPLICTEYMARTNNSTFENSMPMMKQENVGAINWGLVSGKTNTIYAWNTVVADGSEPETWFHDIFRKDGTVFSQAEVDLIKKLNGKQ